MFTASNFYKAPCAVAVAAMMVMILMMMAVTADAMPKATRSHKKSVESAKAETVPLHVDPEVFSHHRNIRPLQNASISPWTYNVSSDHSLFPPVLSEARCLLRGCLNKAGQEDLNLESRPIMHQVLVLRRIRSPGEEPGYHYRLETRLIAVGCTCVRPTIRIQH
ncbi:interleukin-17F-like [Pholidichthys leucotaenia]